MQDSHLPHGSMSGPGLRQLMDLAKILAVVVLPTPRGPQKRYAWASCPRRMEFFKVLAMFSWPMSDSKVSGLYFLADTINCSITDNRTNIVTTSRTPAKFLANRH